MSIWLSRTPKPPLKMSDGRISVDRSVRSTRTDRTLESSMAHSVHVPASTSTAIASIGASRRPSRDNARRTLLARSLIPPVHALSPASLRSIVIALPFTSSMSASIENPSQSIRWMAGAAARWAMLRAFTVNRSWSHRVNVAACWPASLTIRSVMVNRWHPSARKPLPCTPTMRTPSNTQSSAATVSNDVARCPLPVSAND